MAGKPRDRSAGEEEKFDIDKALNNAKFLEFLSRDPDGESLLEVHDAKSIENVRELH